MNRKKQDRRHEFKVAHSCRNHAMIVCSKLMKEGILVKPYKRGKKWYVTEVIKGAKVLRILDSLREAKEQQIGTK